MQRLANSLLARLRRQPLLAVAVLVVLIAVVYLLTVRLRADRHYNAALTALEAGDFDEAKAQLAMCLELRPHSAEIRMLAARTARRMDRDETIDEAVHHLRLYESENGPSDDLELERTLLRVQTQGPSPEDDAALRHKLDAGRVEPLIVFEALTLGYRRARVATATLQCANELLQLEPDHVRGLVARGWALEQFYRMEQAMDDYHRAVELDPANVQARLSLGELLVNFNRSAEAVGHFEWLRRQEPDNVGAGYGLAQCRAALGELDEAASLLDELLERHDTNPQLLEMRGDVAYRQGKTSEAIGFLQDAVGRAPYLRLANFDLAQCLLRQGQTAEAHKYQQQVDRIDADGRRLGDLYKILSGPTYSAAQCHEAAVLSLRLGREEDAMRWLEAALAKDATLPEAHALMAEIYERHGDRHNAESHRKQAQRK